MLDTNKVELSRDDDFQHNVSYHDRADKVESMMAEILKKKSGGASAAAASKAHVVASSTPAAAAV